MSFSDPDWQANDWRMSGSMKTGVNLGAANGRLMMHVLRTKSKPQIEDLKREDRLRDHQERPETPPPQLDPKLIDEFDLVSAHLLHPPANCHLPPTWEHYEQGANNYRQYHFLGLSKPQTCPTNPSGTRDPAPTARELAPGTLPSIE